MSQPPPPYYGPPQAAGLPSKRERNSTTRVLVVLVVILATLLVAAIVVVGSLLATNNEATRDPGSSDPHAEWYDEESTAGEGPIVDVEPWTTENLIEATCEPGYYQNGGGLNGAAEGSVCFGPIQGSGHIYYGIYNSEFEAENDAAVGFLNGYVLEPLEDGRFFMVAGEDAERQLQPLTETYGLAVIPAPGL